MSGMFKNCISLNNLDISNFNTSNVTIMYSMFYGCSNLESLDISNFNTSNVTNMTNMFRDCNNLNNLDISNFDTSNVNDMGSMFSGCSNLSNLDIINNFDTSNVNDISGIFSGCSNLNSLDISNFDTSNVIDMHNMFSGCSNLNNLDISNFDTSNVINMGNMFSGCSNLNNLDISNFDTSNVNSMTFMFSGCSNLNNLDISNFDTSNVNDMSYMFSGCSNLNNLDISNFDTSNVINMGSMFSGCSSVNNLNLSSFNTSNVRTMWSMFSSCSNLDNLDLSNFDTGNVIDMDYIFYGCEKITSINTPYNITESVELPGTGWKLSDGTEITELLPNLNYSITITRKLSDVTEDDNDNQNNNDSDDNSDQSNSENSNNNNNQTNNDSNNNNDQTNNDTSTPTPDNPESDNPTWIGDKDTDTESNGSSSGTIEGTGSTEDITSYGPRLLTITPTAYNKIQLSWDAVPGAKSYEIFYSTSPDSGYKRLANVKKTFYRFSRAKCGITYYFQMRVCQKGAKSAFGPVSYGKTELTGSPSLQIKKTSYNSVTLKWSKVAGAKKYEIFYADSLDGEWHSLGLKGGTSFTHKKLMTGATYYYQIRPIRDSFYGRWSNGVSTTTFLDNVNKLKVKAASADRMKLTWKKVKGASYYVILRADSIDGTYEMIAHATKSSYIDTGLQSGTTYFYKVYAVSGPYKTKETAPVGQTTKIAKK
jgi:surface protein